MVDKQMAHPQPAMQPESDVAVNSAVETNSHRAVEKAQSLRLIHLLNLLVLAVTAIFALLPTRFPPLAVVIGLALLLVPVLLRKVLIGRFTAGGAANWFAGLIVFVVTPVAVWASPVPETTWPFLVRLLWGGALYFALLNWPQSERTGKDNGALPGHLRQLTVVYVGLGVLVTAIDAFILYLPYRIPGILDLDGNRLALFGSWLADAVVHQPNENQLAGVALLYIPLLLTLLFAPAAHTVKDGLQPSAPPVEWFRAFCGLSLIYFLAILLLTGSRGGLLANILALGIVPLLLSRRTRILALLIGVGGAGVILWIGPLRLVNSVAVLERGAAPATTIVDAVLTDRNLQGRFMIWERAFHAIADKPLTGVGLGAFGHLAEQPYPKLPNFQPDPDIGYAHNIWLQTGVDLGIPGLAAYLLLWALVLRHLWLLVRRSLGHSEFRYWGIGLAACAGAFLLWSSIDTVPTGSLESLVVWAAMGIILAAPVSRRHSTLGRLDTHDRQQYR